MCIRDRSVVACAEFDLDSPVSHSLHCDSIVLSNQKKLEIIEKFEKGQTLKSLKDEYGIGD